MAQFIQFYNLSFVNVAINIPLLGVPLADPPACLYSTASGRVLSGSAAASVLRTVAIAPPFHPLTQPPAPSLWGYFPSGLLRGRGLGCGRGRAPNRF